jgi:pSer/pThr/pTyr-binding forkhead associated (FHA) protein
METKGSFRLTLRQGPTPGKVYELVKDHLSIGRDVSNDIVINDAEVSRNHARLMAQAGSYQLEDLASTNGSFVNGHRLTGPKFLTAGDVVGLGETVILDFAFIPDANATVVASRISEPLTTPSNPPRRPNVEPVTPAAPPAPAPTPAIPSYSPPPLPPSAPPPPPRPESAPVMAAPTPEKDNRIMYIGVGCGCVTLCACAGLVGAIAANWPYVSKALGL